MNGVKSGVSAAASWAWGTSLIVGMEIAQTKGRAAWGIWATANAATLAVFGALTRSGLLARPETRGAPEPQDVQETPTETQVAPSVVCPNRGEVD